MRSWIIEAEGAKRVLYQEGSMAMIQAPEKLISGYSSAKALEVGTVMFCGTFPAMGGIRPATRFIMEIEDPVLERKLGYAYDIEVLPVVE